MTSSYVEDVYPVCPHKSVVVYVLRNSVDKLRKQFLVTTFPVRSEQIRDFLFLL